MFFYIKNNWRWPVGCLIFLTAACNGPTAAPLIVTSQDSITHEQLIARALKAIDSTSKIIKTGDLIVRTGNDFTSESLRSLNQKDQTYSHCGIASIENDSLFVYHAIGGEFVLIKKLEKTHLRILQHRTLTEALAFTDLKYHQQLLAIVCK